MSQYVCDTKSNYGNADNELTVITKSCPIPEVLKIEIYKITSMTIIKQILHT